MISHNDRHNDANYINMDKKEEEAVFWKIEISYFDCTGVQVSCMKVAFTVVMV